MVANALSESPICVTIACSGTVYCAPLTTLPRLAPTLSHSATRMLSVRRRERRVRITKRALPSNSVRYCCHALTCAVLASACSDSDTIVQRTGVCDPQISPYALIVTVLDSTTARPIALQTTGTADASGVHDTLLLFSPGDSARLHSSKNVQGRYRITLDRPGYRTWIAYGVNVVWSQCAGGNVAVVARMQAVTP